MIDNEFRDYCFDKMEEIRAAAEKQGLSPSQLTTWGHSNVAAGINLQIRTQLDKPIKNSKIYFPMAVPALCAKVELDKPCKFRESGFNFYIKPEIIQAAQLLRNEFNALISEIMGQSFRRNAGVQDSGSTMFSDFKFDMDLPFDDSRHLWSPESRQVEADWYLHNPRAKKLAQIPREFLR